MYRGPHNSGPYRQGSRQVGEAGRRLRVGTIFPRNNARPNKTADSRSRSLRSLNIRYLKTVHGDLLDMEDTVGAIFDDRADFPDKMSSIEILPTSIVQVYRYPPEPQELANIPRYGSLMPESSARPRKRPLTIPAQISRTDDRAIATIEGLDDMQQEENFLEPNKRQRTLEVHGDRPYGLCGKYQSGEAQEAGLNRAPQGPGRPGSIHQVDDSQKSSARRQPNPYGTPTSPSLVSLQEPLRRSQIDVTSIPDSPLSTSATAIERVSGTTVNIERERTKSESPEMPLSVHDVPHAEVESVILQPNSEVEALENSQPSYAIDEPLPPGSVAHETDALKKIDTRNVRQEVRREPSNHRTPSRRTHEPVSASSYQIRQTNGSRRHSTQIFDEIESDSESFRQRQQMYSAKRMRLDRTAPERLSSPCDPPGSTGDKSGGHFLIPSTPLSRQNGSRIISGELSVLHKPQDATPFDPQRTASHSQSKNLGSGFQHLPQSGSVQAAQGQNPQTLVPAKSSGEDSTNDEIQHEPRPLSQCTTTWSQASDSFPKNCSHLDVEHPIKKALSEGRKPDFSSLTNAENSSDDKENHRSLQTQRVERMAQKVGGQQNRQTLGECRVEKQRSPTNAVEKQGELDGVEEASSTAVQEALQGGIEEKTTPETISEEEKSCAEQLEEATKTSIDSRDESHTGVLAATTENQPVVNKREENMRSSRDRQSKEKTLSEQAQQMMLKADGAMQLQVEKLQKQKTPTSASKGSTMKTPKSTKYPPRTDEQKAARKQREAKKKAKPRKAVETKGTLNWADQLFEESSVGVRQNSENIDTDTEEDKMLKTSTKSKPSTRAIEKPNISSAEIAHSSPTPSEASILSRNRKSLTPALPNTSTTKSPHKASLLSSSPLASGPSASVDTPLRSALKQNQTPSTLRRSVSFVNDHGDNDRARTADIFSSSSASHARPMKSLVELNNELALTSMPAGISTAPFGELPISKTARQSIDKKEMVQQKLNVIRDKKLKGRMPDPPISSRSTPEREGKSLFSDCSSVSDFSSDEDLGNGNAEAGPSSRKKSVRGVQPRQNSAVKTPTPVTPVDPALEKIRPIRGTSESPRPALRLKSVSDPLSPSRSTSRSPALRMSETVSMTSGSTSSSESGSGSDSDSDSIDSHESPAAKTSNNATSGTPLDAKIRDIGKSVKGERQSSPNSEVFCTGNYNNHVNNKAVQQSQLNRAEPASAQSTSNTSQDDENNRADKGNPWLSTRDRLLNSTRPTPFKYPTFTNFRMMAEATTPEEEAVALAAPQNPALLQEDEDDSSSSSSDESTSNSDEESSQKGSKSKSGMFRAVRSLVNNYQRFRAGK